MPLHREVLCYWPEPVFVGSAPGPNSSSSAFSASSPPAGPPAVWVHTSHSVALRSTVGKKSRLHLKITMSYPKRSILRDTKGRNWTQTWKSGSWSMTVFCQLMFWEKNQVNTKKAQWSLCHGMPELMFVSHWQMDSPDRLHGAVNQLSHFSVSLPPTVHLTETQQLSCFSWMSLRTVRVFCHDFVMSVMILLWLEFHIFSVFFLTRGESTALPWKRMTEWGFGNHCGSHVFFSPELDFPDSCSRTKLRTQNSS